MAGQIVRNTASMMPNAAANAPVQEAAKKSITTVMNSILDSEGYRKRFEDLLGKRTPQFVSSLVSLVNGDSNLQKAFQQSPVTVVQAALKAAAFDLPIDPGLGYAYIVPFNNSKKNPDGTYTKTMEAAFVLGYKGMNQLALRTGAYSRLNVVDVRQGELVKYDRLREDIELQFVEDEEERARLPIVGWCGYFRLVNGTEKTIYMTRKQVEEHEKANRKGQYMGKGWRENFDAMAEKTVFRRLVGRWGLMSIDYQRADAATIAAAEAIATGKFDDLDEGDIEILPDEVSDTAEQTEGAAQ